MSWSGKIKLFLIQGASGNDSRRESWIDLSKAVAIYLVLVGHVVQYSGKSGPENCLWAFIYSFHMPLFMFMSGMFALKSMNLTTGRFVSKKFVQLLLPVASWGVFDVLLLHGEVLKYLDLVSLSGVYLWFLKVLFLCYMIMFVINNISIFTSTRVFRCGRISSANTHTHTLSLSLSLSSSIAFAACP